MCIPTEFISFTTSVIYSTVGKLIIFKKVCYLGYAFCPFVNSGLFSYEKIHCLIPEQGDLILKYQEYRTPRSIWNMTSEIFLNGASQNVLHRTL